MWLSITRRTGSKTVPEMLTLSSTRLAGLHASARLSCSLEAACSSHSSRRCRTQDSAAELGIRAVFNRGQAPTERSSMVTLVALFDSGGLKPPAIAAALP